MGMMNPPSSWAMRTNQLFLLVCALATLASTASTHATAGVSNCLDPANDNYLCAPGTTSIFFQSPCEPLSDADVPALKACFDTAGREGLTRIWLSGKYGGSISSFDGVFENLPTLKQLTLGSEAITTLPAGLFEDIAGTLKRLKIQTSPLVTTLPEDLFMGLSKLKQLEISGLDKLRTLPVRLFKATPKVKTLNLSSNGLVALPLGIFDGLIRVETLTLTYNFVLTTLPSGLFEPLTKLKTMYLNGNTAMQCIPPSTATTIRYDSGVGGGTCECEPSEGMLCPTGTLCSPGLEGYTCGPESTIPEATVAPCAETTAGEGAEEDESSFHEEMMPFAPTVDYEMIGCYTDKYAHERIMGRFLHSHSMTVEMCRAHCAGSIYFGVQHGNECFCDTATGDEDYPFDVHGVSTGCTMPCSENQEQTCGGEWAMNVYKNNLVPPPSVPVGYQGLGCYGDKYAHERIMGKFLHSDSMTVEECKAHCDGSIYFGVQHGTECYCDTATGDEDYPFDVHGVSTGCTMPCSGNQEQTCGGGLAMNVYMNEMVPRPVTPTPSVPVEVGCYEDKKYQRIMVDKLYSKESMTVEMCQEHCDGSTYFGVQYGTACWCDTATGDEDYPFDIHGVSTRCTMPCSGDKAQQCGGWWAMKVYMNTD